MKDSANKLMNLFIKMQEQLKPDLSIEVGAYEATFSKMIYEKLGIECYAFEANPYNYEQFCNTMPGVNYLNLAVSDTDDKINFQFQEKTIDGFQFTKGLRNNSIMERNDATLTYSNLSVTSITLDSYFLEKFKKNICLWIDVEGASQKVLNGGNKLLDFCDSILIEVESKEFWKNQWLVYDVKKFLEEQGFIAIARDYQFENQFNIIFIKEKFLKNEKIIELLRKFHLDLD